MAADRPLAGALGTAWCACDPGRRAAVAANRAAIGAGFPLSSPFVHSVYALLGWLRLVALGSTDVLRATSVTGLDALRDAARERRGTVLVAAHVGEWEWGAAALAARGLEVVAVAGIQMRGEWTPALRAAKARLGVTVVGPDVSPLRLVRALARGAVVALLVDGDVATATRPARVLERDVPLPEGPARLAARTGARLVAGRCARDRAGTHYAIRLAPLDEEEANGSADALHARVADWLTAVVREDPGAWCLFRPFFAPTPSARAIAHAQKAAA